MSKLKKELDLGLLVAVVHQINLDAGKGDYTVIEELFQFLDQPELRLKQFIEQEESA